MRFTRTLAPAAMLLAAAGLHAQTTTTLNPLAGGPTTGGTVQAPLSPTVGGTAPTRVPLIFPTDPAATARAASGVRPPTTRTFPTLAFQSSGVPSALGLTDRQRTQIDTFTQQLQAQFQSQYDRLAGLRAAEQAAAREQLNREYLAAWLNAARDVFDDTQLARYQQLQLQFGGLDGLTDPVAQRALNLTDEQVAQLREQMAWSQQQQSWAQLTGDPFTFQPVFPAATGAAVIGPGGVPFTPGVTGTTVTGPNGAPLTPGATGTTGPRVTGPNGAPISGPAAGPTQLTPIAPGTPGPTTGGAAPGPVGPTTGGAATAPGPTTGGTRPAPGPTTGGTRPAGGPTTGGTAPGGPGNPRR